MTVTAAHAPEHIIPQSHPETPRTRNSIRDFLEMIKFEHTLFALPFAYTGALLGGQGHVSLIKFLLITLAMVTARTAGMSLNRLIDRHIDKANPRTADRALPRGIISVGTVRGIVAVSLLGFFVSTLLLNRLALFLAPLAVAILLGYSYLKRFTWLCHLGLGFVLACAPIGGWVAVTGHLGAVPIALGAAMLFWLAGFDVLYGCLDAEFDERFGLHSIPQRFGIKKALWVSACFHLITFALLALSGILADLGWPYDIGLIGIAALLIYEHTILTPKDLSRINQAFFQANAAISLVMLVGTAASFWVTR